MKSVRCLLIGLVALTATMVWAGEAEAQGSSIYVDYYTPQFYGDRLVFFDEEGTPIFYEDNEAYTVPSDYGLYQKLVDFFIDNMDAYYDWFDEVGYMHLHYRRPMQADYYQPMYYLDYPVFYKNDGRPYYYVDGVRVWVPAGDPLYRKLRRHYRRHQDQYRRWNREYGRYMRWYQRPVFSNYY